MLLLQGGASSRRRLLLRVAAAAPSGRIGLCGVVVVARSGRAAKPKPKAAVRAAADRHRSVRPRRLAPGFLLQRNGGPDDQ